MVQNESCSALAFYGFRKQVDKEHIYSATLDWLSRIDCAPDLLGLGGKSFPSKMGSFAKRRETLLTKGFESLVDFEFVTLDQRPKKSKQEFRVSVAVSFQSPSYATIAVNSALANLNELHNEIGVKIALELKPDYGFGYTRLFSQGPALYAVGLSQGLKLTGPEYDEALRISRWANVGIPNRVYRKGILRDIYPLNYLSKYQWNIQVDGRSLRDWIVQESQGNITPVNDKLILWTVDAAKIDVVRSLIAKNRAIFGPADWVHS